MRILLALLALAFASAAYADEPALPPNIQAMQQTIIKLTGESLQWQTQALALKAENEELKKQIDLKNQPKAK